MRRRIIDVRELRLTPRKPEVVKEPRTPRLSATLGERGKPAE
jgi:hypothetical protein